MGSISRWGESAFTDAEKSALHFTERLFVDHQNIDDALFDELRRFYTEEQIIELGWAVVSYMGFGRLIHAFGIRPEMGDASEKRP